MNSVSKFDNYIFRQKFIRFLGLFASVILFSLVSLIISPIARETSCVEAAANPSTITLTITSGSVASVDVTPTSASGQDSRLCVDSLSSQPSPMYDIYPKGRRLPTGGSSGEFQTLYDQYNSAALMRKSVSNDSAAFALADYFNNSSPTYQGSYDYYWSSTRHNNANMYRLNLNTSNVYPADYGDRSRGGSIRCILQ